jgi:hypothetical protein
MKSLRQKQIDEVLDYHKNMNQAVFNRQVRQVQASNESRSAPHKTDIETEAGLRDKVDAMKINLQQINQYMYGTKPSSGMSLDELLTLKRSSEEDDDLSGVFGDPAAKEYGRLYREQERTFTKASDKVQSSLSSLVNEWNTLVNFYELKNRVKVFSESEQNALVGIIKELIDPIKELIGNIMKFKQPGKEGDMYYTSYNVLTTIMKNIESAPPLVKVQPNILTDKTGFTQDFSPVENLNYTSIERFKELYDSLNEQYSEASRMVANTQVEKDAKQRFLSKLDTEFNKIKSIQVKADAQLKQLREKRDTDPAIFRKFSESLQRNLEKFNKRIYSIEPPEYLSEPDIEDIEPVSDDDDTEGEEKDDPDEKPKERKKYSRIQQRLRDQLDKVNEAISLVTSDTSTTVEERAALLKQLYQSKREIKDKIGKKKGGAHYPYGTDQFGDESLLAPYLTRHVKPSKFHGTKKPDVSSSDESSQYSGSDDSEDEIGGRRKKHMNKKNQRMLVEMKQELPKQGKAGLAILEQIMVKPRTKRGAGKKKKKPVMEYNDDNDMWFL